MTRQFSFGTVFRMTGKTVLKSFFNHFNVDTADVPWDKLRRNDIDIIQKFFDELLPDKRNEAEIILRHAHAGDTSHLGSDETLTIGQKMTKNRPSVTFVTCRNVTNLSAQIP